MSSDPNVDVDAVEVSQIREQRESDVRCHTRGKKELNDLGLDTLYDELRSRLYLDDPIAVRKFYEAGKLLLGLYERYSDQEARKIIDQLSRMECLNSRVLAACYKFAREFTQNDVLEVQGYQNAETGKRVTQTHLQYVMVDAIVDKTDPITGAVTKATQIRKYYLKDAVEHNLSAIDMRKVIQVDYFERTPEKKVGGRPHIMPGNPDQMLMQISDFIDKPLKKCRDVWFKDDSENIVTILDSQPETVTEVTRSEVLTALSKVAELRNFLDRITEILQQKDSDYMNIVLRNYDQSTSRVEEAEAAKTRQNIRILSE